MKLTIIFKNLILILGIPLIQKIALLVAEGSTVKFIKNKNDHLQFLYIIYILKNNINKNLN